MTGEHMTKRFQDLNLKDAFLFAAALDDEETCRLVLEMIFGRKIGKVQVNVEHTILYTSDIHSIRLDVYASDTAQVDYDIEMQNDSKADLPKRSRYYQGQMDIAGLKPGEDYHDLKPNYVIFICTYDPFGHGLFRYTYEMCCKETEEPLNDGVYRIFLSTKWKNKEDVPEELVNFLGYIEQTTDEYVNEHKDDSLKQLHNHVSRLKKDRKLEGCYMTVEDLLKEQRKEWLERGMQQGQKESLENVGKLCALMNADGRMDEYISASQSPQQLQKLFKEYGLH